MPLKRHSIGCKELRTRGELSPSLTLMILARDLRCVPKYGSLRSLMRCWPARISTASVGCVMKSAPYQIAIAFMKFRRITKGIIALRLTRIRLRCEDGVPKQSARNKRRNKLRQNANLKTRRGRSMALFKRGDVWYFEFVYGGRRYVKSTRVKNQRK